MQKIQEPRDLASRLSATNHLLHAAGRALRGKSFAKRLQRAGAAFDNASVEELRTAMLDSGMAAEIRKFTNRGPEFEEFDPAIASDRQPLVKALAFYLPQYHEIPENNEWWGNGFTEWTNVARGAPRFVGHYQPRVPRDLGFYSLTGRTVPKRQAELAKAAGIHGFCFYYYWFGGARLLEKPLETFLRSPKIDMDYCLMWANESWTRRWDGEEENVLMQQDYEKHDDAAFVDALVRHFRDRRYIRIGDRPLFFIYRVPAIPNARDRIAKWRELFWERHAEDPVIFMAQTRGDVDPRIHGLDGAIAFPPHGLTADSLIDVGRLGILDRDFRGSVHSYDALVQKSVSESSASFPLIKTVMPSWDNDARKPGNGLVIHGSSPEKYRAWLEHTVDYALQHPIFGESFVAINAWNEWAEAAYLEPDVHYGGAYLNATAKALCGTARGAEAGAVEHSQEPSGPQDFDTPSAASAVLERSLPQGYFTKVRSEVFHMIGEPVGKVLELGCGTGNTIAELKRQGLAEWVGGIELEPAAAAQIPEDVDQVWIGNFENMTLDPPPHDIDLILCLDVLEHLVDPWSTIKRLHHFLAPGGAIIASIPNIRNKDILRSLILRGEWKYQDWGILDRTHLRFFTKDSAKELMECSGLSVDRIEPAEPISFKPWQMGALLNRITRGRYGEFQVVQFLIRARHSAAAS